MSEQPERDPVTGHFVKGKKGGPGRPKGSKRKDISRAFLDALEADFLGTSENEKGEEVMNGAEAIRRCREEKPTDYVKALVGLLPKELLVRSQPLDEMSDDEIHDAIAVISEFIGGTGGGAPRPTHSRGGKA